MFTVTKKRTTAILTRGSVLAVLIVFAVAAVYPLVFMVLSTFRTSGEYLSNPLSLPATLTYLDNYVAMFNRFNVAGLFLNTLLYVVLAALISLCASIPAAFALAKLRFSLSRLFLILVVASMTMPAIIFIIPNYIFMSDVGLVDSFWSVVLLWAATSVPGSIFLLTSFMRGLPGEVIEATRVDGASYVGMMARVVIPMSLPGIVTITIFNVTAWWNDLLIPLVFLQSDEKMTITVAVATIVGRYATDYPLLMTGLLMASLPPVLIYVFIQRYIRRGLVVGAVK